MKWKVTCCVFEVDDGACLKDAVSRLDVACRPPLTDFGTNKPNVDFADFFWSATGAGRAGPARPSPAPPHSQQNGSSGAGGRAAWQRARFPPPRGRRQACFSFVEVWTLVKRSVLLVWHQLQALSWEVCMFSLHFGALAFPPDVQKHQVAGLERLETAPML